MAWYTKYRLEIADRLGIVWKNDILVDAESQPDIITMKGSGNPMSIEYYGDDDLFEQPICGSKLTIEVISETDFAYSELFTSNNFQYKSLLYRGATLYWSGYILANNFQEPYNCIPYPVSIVATDGLGLLSDYQYKELEHTGRNTLAKIIYDILGKVGITSFIEYIEMSEESMFPNSSAELSTLDRCGLYVDLFDEMTCYDALAAILKAFNAAIRQDGGVFHIFRVADLVGLDNLAGVHNSTMYGNIYTSATSHTATTRTPAQYLTRTGRVSTFTDIEGGTQTTLPGVKTFYVNQNYGARESILKNHDFNFNEFEYSTAWSIDGWTLSSGTEITPLSTQLPQQGSDIGVFINTADTVMGTHKISQGVDCLAGGNLVMEFEISGITADGADHAGAIYVAITNNDGVNTKYFNGSWTTTPSYLLLKSDTFTPNLDFSTHAFYINDVPYAGNIIVYLCAAQSSAGNVYAVFKSARLFFINSDHQLIEGIGYTVQNATHGQIIEKELLIGDGPGYSNDPVMYKGVLHLYPEGADFGVTTREWTTRENPIPRPLIHLIAGELGNQFSRAKYLLDISIYETSANTVFSLVGNLQDDLNKVNGANRIFGPTRGNYNIKERMWDLTLNEIVIWPSPIPVSAVVATPNHCIITFDLDLDSTIVPGAENFVFLRAGSLFSPGTVTGVAISGKTVDLTLASNVTSGLSYVVTYTTPLNNYLVADRGTLVETFMDFEVTNNV